VIAVLIVILWPCLFGGERWGRWMIALAGGWPPGEGGHLAGQSDPQVALGVVDA
jgi:hypothetical protein